MLQEIVFANQLPVLLFTLPGGALVDRWDRRTVLWTVDSFRAIDVVALAAAVLTGWASIPRLAAAGFFSAPERPCSTPPPRRSSRPSSPATRSGWTGPTAASKARRPSASSSSARQPVASCSPWLLPSRSWINAISFAASSALLAAIPGRFRHQRQATYTTTLRTEIMEGLRWLLAHRLLRAIAIMVGVTNLLAGAWLAILVLFAKDELHVTDTGYGLLLAAFAAGGTLGSLFAARLSQRFGTARVLLAEVVLEGVTTVALGLAANAWLAGALLVALGFQVLVWNVVSASLRQALLPDQLIGRVISAYRPISLGGRWSSVTTTARSSPRSSATWRAPGRRRR